jgi:hypothetical protein
MIGNGVLVSLLCLWFVRPFFVERLAETGTSEAKHELLYLNAIIPMGLLVSTVVANLYLFLIDLRAERTD